MDDEDKDPGSNQKASTDTSEGLSSRRELAYDVMRQYWGKILRMKGVCAMAAIDGRHLLRACRTR